MYTLDKEKSRDVKCGKSVFCICIFCHNYTCQCFFVDHVNMFVIIHVASNFASACLGLVSVCSQLRVCVVLSLSMVIVMCVFVWMCVCVFICFFAFVFFRVNFGVRATSCVCVGAFGVCVPRLHTWLLVVLVCV